MTKTFSCKLLNSPYNDPVMMLEFTRKQRLFLFDIGDLSTLPQRLLQKISHVFISHMHIDHFFGFDTLLRSILSREEPLNVYGPIGIIDAVQGKLSGYTWNLVKSYPIKIEVFEITNTSITSAGFYAQEGFQKISKGNQPFSGIIYSESDFRINASIFDHQIPVLGFSIVSDINININKTKMIELGFNNPGPWINELKDKIRANDLLYKLIIDGREYSINDLKDMVIVSKGQKIVYITDIAPSKENIDTAITLASDADILFIEAYFLEQDSDHAAKKGHITARLAGYIAGMAVVKNIEITHISKKYIDMEKVVKDEVNTGFTLAATVNLTYVKD
jgi:ribonuclease Z